MVGARSTKYADAHPKLADKEMRLAAVCVHRRAVRAATLHACVRACVLGVKVQRMRGDG